MEQDPKKKQFARRAVGAPPAEETPPRAEATTTTTTTAAAPSAAVAPEPKWSAQPGPVARPTVARAQPQQQQPEQRQPDPSVQSPRTVQNRRPGAGASGGNAEIAYESEKRDQFEEDRQGQQRTEHAGRVAEGRRREDERRAEMQRREQESANEVERQRRIDGENARRKLAFERQGRDTWIDPLDGMVKPKDTEEEAKARQMAKAEEEARTKQGKILSDRRALLENQRDRLQVMGSTERTDAEKEAERIEEAERSYTQFPDLVEDPTVAEMRQRDLAALPALKAKLAADDEARQERDKYDKAILDHKDAEVVARGNVDVRGGAAQDMRGHVARAKEVEGQIGGQREQLAGQVAELEAKRAEKLQRGATQADIFKMDEEIAAKATALSARGESLDQVEAEQAELLKQEAGRVESRARTEKAAVASQAVGDRIGLAPELRWQPKQFQKATTARPAYDMQAAGTLEEDYNLWAWEDSSFQKEWKTGEGNVIEHGATREIVAKDLGGWMEVENPSYAARVLDAEATAGRDVYVMPEWAMEDSALQSADFNDPSQRSVLEKAFQWYAGTERTGAEFDQAMKAWSEGRTQHEEQSRANRMGKEEFRATAKEMVASRDKLLKDFAPSMEKLVQKFEAGQIDEAEMEAGRKPLIDQLAKFGEQQREMRRNAIDRGVVELGTYIREAGEWADTTPIPAVQEVMADVSRKVVAEGGTRGDMLRARLRAIDGPDGYIDTYAPSSAFFSERATSKAMQEQGLELALYTRTVDRTMEKEGFKTREEAERYLEEQPGLLGSAMEETAAGSAAMVRSFSTDLLGGLTKMVGIVAGGDEDLDPKEYKMAGEPAPSGAERGAIVTLEGKDYVVMDGAPEKDGDTYRFAKVLAPAGAMANGFYKAGKAIEEFGQDSMWMINSSTRTEGGTSEMLGGALGTTISFMLGGAAFGAMGSKVARWLGSGSELSMAARASGQVGKAEAYVGGVTGRGAMAVMGGGPMGAEQYEMARLMGATEEDALLAFQMGTAAGMTEAISLSSSIRNILGGGVRKGAMKKGAEIVSEGFEEASQEGIQTVGSNLARMVYDEDTDLSDNLEGNMLVGGLIGMGLAGVTQAVETHLAPKRFRKAWTTQMKAAETAFDAEAGSLTAPEKALEIVRAQGENGDADFDIEHSKAAIDMVGSKAPVKHATAELLTEEMESAMEQAERSESSITREINRLVREEVAAAAPDKKRRTRIALLKRQKDATWEGLGELATVQSNLIRTGGREVVSRLWAGMALDKALKNNIALAKKLEGGSTTTEGGQLTEAAINNSLAIRGAVKIAAGIEPNPSEAKAVAAGIVTNEGTFPVVEVVEGYQIVTDRVREQMNRLVGKSADVLINRTESQAAEWARQQPAKRARREAKRKEQEKAAKKAEAEAKIEEAKKKKTAPDVQVNEGEHGFDGGDTPTLSWKGNDGTDKSVTLTPEEAKGLGFTDARKALINKRRSVAEPGERFAPEGFSGLPNPNKGGVDVENTPEGRKEKPEKGGTHRTRTAKEVKDAGAGQIGHPATPFWQTKAKALAGRDALKLPSTYEPVQTQPGTWVLRSEGEGNLRIEEDKKPATKKPATRAEQVRALVMDELAKWGDIGVKVEFGGKDPNFAMGLVKDGDGWKIAVSDEGDAGTRSDKELRSLVVEEMIHVLVKRSLADAEVAAIWDKLALTKAGKAAQAKVRKAYLRNAKEGSEIWNRLNNPVNLGHEFIRMIAQGKLGVEISELASQDPSLWSEILKQLAILLKNLKKLPKEFSEQVDPVIQNIVAAMRKQAKKEEVEEEEKYDGPSIEQDRSTDPGSYGLGHPWAPLAAYPETTDEIEPVRLERWTNDPKKVFAYEEGVPLNPKAIAKNADAMIAKLEATLKSEEKKYRKDLAAAKAYLEKGVAGEERMDIGNELGRSYHHVAIAKGRMIDARRMIDQILDTKAKKPLLVDVLEKTGEDGRLTYLVSEERLRELNDSYTSSLGEGKYTKTVTLSDGTVVVINGVGGRRGEPPMVTGDVLLDSDPGDHPEKGQSGGFYYYGRQISGSKGLKWVGPPVTFKLATKPTVGKKPDIANSAEPEPTPADGNKAPVVYASGMTRAGDADFEGVEFIGIAATDGNNVINQRVVEKIQEAANAGKKVFIDSGAFLDFKAGRPTIWPKVYNTYRRIFAEVNPENRKNITVVGPDVVGDSAKTRALQVQFFRTLIDLLDRDGVNVILPIQRKEGATLAGEIDATVAALDEIHTRVPYKEGDYQAHEGWRPSRPFVGRTVGTDTSIGRKKPFFTYGVPYNARAWTKAEVEAYLATPGASAIHLLGGGSTKIAAISNPQGVEVSGDSLYKTAAKRKKGKKPEPEAVKVAPSRADLIASTVANARAEMEAMRVSGKAPAYAKTFADFQEITDANMLVNSPEIGAFGKANGWKQADYIEFTTEVIEILGLEQSAEFKPTARQALLQAIFEVNPGDIVEIDGDPEYTGKVIQKFPEGSTSFISPHITVEVIDGTPGERVKVTRFKKIEKPQGEAKPGTEVFVQTREGARAALMNSGTTIWGSHTAFTTRQQGRWIVSIRGPGGYTFSEATREEAAVKAASELERLNAPEAEAPEAEGGAKTETAPTTEPEPEQAKVGHETREINGRKTLFLNTGAMTALNKVAGYTVEHVGFGDFELRVPGRKEAVHIMRLHEEHEYWRKDWQGRTHQLGRLEESEIEAIQNALGGEAKQKEEGAEDIAEPKMMPDADQDAKQKELLKQITDAETLADLPSEESLNDLAMVMNFSKINPIYLARSQREKQIKRTAANNLTIPQINEAVDKKWADYLEKAKERGFEPENREKYSLYWHAPGKGAFDNPGTLAYDILRPIFEEALFARLKAERANSTAPQAENLVETVLDSVLTDSGVHEFLKAPLRVQFRSIADQLAFDATTRWWRESGKPEAKRVVGTMLRPEINSSDNWFLSDSQVDSIVIRAQRHLGDLFTPGPGGWGNNRKEKIDNIIEATGIEDPRPGHKKKVADGKDYGKTPSGTDAAPATVGKPISHYPAALRPMIQAISPGPPRVAKKDTEFAEAVLALWNAGYPENARDLFKLEQGGKFGLATAKYLRENPVLKKALATVKNFSFYSGQTDEVMRATPDQFVRKSRTTDSYETFDFPSIAARNMDHIDQGFVPETESSIDPKDFFTAEALAFITGEKPQTPQTPKAKPAAKEPIEKDDLDDEIESLGKDIGLFSAPRELVSYRMELGPDKAPAIMSIAMKAIAKGVDTPVKLAERLERLRPDGKLRAISQNLWSMIDSLRGTETPAFNWDDIYRDIDSASGEVEEPSDEDKRPEGDRDLNIFEEDNLGERIREWEGGKIVAWSTPKGDKVGIFAKIEGEEGAWMSIGESVWATPRSGESLAEYAGTLYQDPRSKAEKLHAAAKEIAARIKPVGLVTRDTIIPEKIRDTRALNEIIKKHTGMTVGEGEVNQQDAYEALEVAVSIRVLEDGIAKMEPQQAFDAIDRILELIPTQTVRSEEKNRLQQFSTPPQLSYLAARAAKILPGHLVAETSVGTGALAAFAKGHGARVWGNEIDPDRIDLALEAGIVDDTTLYNGERIDLLSRGDGIGTPDRVVINPPFTNSLEGATKSNDVTANHIDAALRLLPEGGRLVAVVGRGMGFDNATQQAWWSKIRRENAVRANIPTSGDLYRKYGTGFGNRILVIDKIAPDGTPPIAPGQELELPMEIEALLARIPEPGDLSKEGGQSDEDSGDNAGPTGDDGGAGERDGGGDSEQPAGGEGGDVPGVDGEQQDGDRGGSAGGAGKPGKRGGAKGGGTVPGGGVSDTGDTGGDQSGGEGKQERGPSASDSTESTVETGVESGEAPEARIVGSGTFSEYKPTITFKNTVAHPSPLVETSSMASIAIPPVDYVPNLPQEIISSGALSDAQLEAIALVGNAFSQKLYDGRRKGFFIGDGTGVGKGREVAGIILDAMRRGHGKKKMLWVSKNIGLMNDAQRDWRGLGGNDAEIFSFNDVTAKQSIKQEEGIAFVSYSSLGSPGLDESGNFNVPVAATARANIMAGDLQKGDIIYYAPRDPDDGNRGRLSDGRSARSGAMWKDELPEGFDPPSEAQWTVTQRAKFGSNHTKLTLKNMVTGEDVLIGHDANNKVGNLANIGAYMVGRPGDQVGRPKTRLEQFVDWVGKDWDGVIALDEAHVAQNLVGANPSAVAQAIEDMQNILPNARIVYVSATGATEVNNLAYLQRLGMWGAGTAFSDRGKFLAEVGESMSTMEMTAMNMKARGVYIARTLSYEGIKADRLHHEFYPHQRAMFDEMARGWQAAIEGFEDGMMVTGAGNSGQARGKAASMFWGSQLRFYESALASFQMPTVLESIDKDLAAGHAVVLQLTKTNLASMERAYNSREEDEELEDLDMSPKETLTSLVRNHYPVHQYVEVPNPGSTSGATIWVVARNPDTNEPIENPEAVAKRDALVASIESIDMPDAPMDQLLEKYGAEKIAEVTGRTWRLERTAAGKMIRATRGKAVGEREARQFQNDERRILMFSEAGGTGFSYHAGKDVKNQRLRKHYLLQAGWRAQTAVQGMGRTHRSFEKQPPEYYLVQTDVKGHARFISTIARRLAQLGALTSGERDSQQSGMFSEADNLESEYATTGFMRMIRSAHADDGYFRSQGGDFTFRDLLDRAGYARKRRDDDGNVVTDYPKFLDPQTGNLRQQIDVRTVQFLNRMLSMELDVQNVAFEAWMQEFESAIQEAKDDGSFDEGTQDHDPPRQVIVARETVNTNEQTGAIVELITLADGMEQNTIPWEVLGRDFPYRNYDPRSETWGPEPVKWLQNTRSKALVAVYARNSTTTNASGQIIRRIWKVRVNGETTGLENEFDTPGWRTVDRAEAEVLWRAQLAALPEVHVKQSVWLSGSVFDIWDRIGFSNKNLFTVHPEGSRSILGILVPKTEINGLRTRLGAGVSAGTYTAQRLWDEVIKDNASFKFANGWTMQRSSVSGALRVELKNMSYRDHGVLQQQGWEELSIAWNPRILAPGLKALQYILDLSPIIEINGEVMVANDKDAPDIPALYKAAKERIEEEGLERPEVRAARLERERVQQARFDDFRKVENELGRYLQYWNRPPAEDAVTDDDPDPQDDIVDDTEFTDLGQAPKKKAKRKGSSGGARTPKGDKKKGAEQDSTGDVGDELIGNLRNKVGKKTWEDLKDADKDLRSKMVTKANVYPKPDYAALVEENEKITPEIAYMVKSIYDAIGTKPHSGWRSGELSESDYEDYVNGVNRLMDHVMAWAKAGGINDPDGYIDNPNERQSPYWWKAESTGGGGRRSLEIKTVITGGTRKLSRAIQENKVRGQAGRKALNAGWPGVVEAYKRLGYHVLNKSEFKPKRWGYHEARLPNGGDLMIRAFEEGGDQKMFHEYTEGNQAQVDAWFDALPEWILTRQENYYGRDYIAFESEEAAVATARTAADSQKSETGQQTRRLTGWGIDMASRTLAPRREEGEDVSSEQLAETFGLRGFNTGNWMTDSEERQKHINFLYDSFYDLADILGVPAKAIGLPFAKGEGTHAIGMAVGAQGKKGAAAHYYANLHEINLTRKNGVGALAHEWAHSLDHYLGRLAGVNPNAENPFLSENYATLPARRRTPETDAGVGTIRREVLDAVTGIMKAMTQRAETAEEYEKRMRRKYERYKNAADSWVRHIQRMFNGDQIESKDRDLVKKLLEEAMDRDVIKASGSYKQLDEIDRMLKEVQKKQGKRGTGLTQKDRSGVVVNMSSAYRMLEMFEQGSPSVTESRYKAEAAKAMPDPGGYWKSNRELWARAFDDYVNTKLEKKNNYLAGASDMTASMGFETVPTGDEKKGIEAAFDKLIEVIETREGPGGVFQIYGAPREGGPVKVTRKLGTNEQYAKAPTDAEAEAALTSNQRPKYGAHRKMIGEKVGVRLDIPSLTRHGVPVQTVHMPGIGAVVGYDSSVILKGPLTFRSREAAAEKISQGQAKAPMAAVEGTYAGGGAGHARPENLNSWVSVGYNPKEHSFFYDKLTDDIIVGGSEAYAVGNSVFVKDPVYGDRNTALFGAPEEREALMSEIEAEMGPPIPAGETSGRNRANPGDTPTTRRHIRDLQAMKDRNADIEAMAAVDARAHQRIAEDEGGFVETIMRKALDGPSSSEVLSAEEVRGAYMLVAKYQREAEASGKWEDIRKADTLTYALDMGKTEVGRALHAMRDTYQTPDERIADLLGMVIAPRATRRFQRMLNAAWTPEAKRKRIAELEKRLADALTNAEKTKIQAEIDTFEKKRDREQIVSDESRKTLEKVRAALAKTGVTVSEVINGKAVSHLRGSDMIKKLLKRFDPDARRVYRLAMMGKGIEEIESELGLGEKKIKILRASVDSKVAAAIRRLVNNGVNINHFRKEDFDPNLVFDKEGNVLGSSPAVDMTAFREMMGAIRPDFETADRRSGKLNPVNGSRRFDPNNPRHFRDISRAMKQAAHGNLFDVYFEYWINNILSGPQTHFVNTVGNMLNIGLNNLIARPLENFYARIFNKLGGQGWRVHSGSDEEMRRILNGENVQAEMGMGDAGGRMSAFKISLSRALAAASYDYQMEDSFWEANVLDEKVDKIDRHGAERTAISERPMEQVIGSVFGRRGEVVGRALDRTADEIAAQTVGRLMSGGKRVVNRALGRVVAVKRADLLKQRLRRVPKGAKATEKDKKLERSLKAKIRISEKRNNGRGEWQFEIDGQIYSTVYESEAAAMKSGRMNASRVNANPLRGRVIRTPGRVLLFADTLAKVLITEGEVGKQAYYLAASDADQLRLVMGSKERDEHIEAIVMDQIQERGSVAWKRAIERAKELTFQTKVRSRAQVKKQGGTDMLDDLLNLPEYAANWLMERERVPGLRHLFPFVRTPFNIFRQGLRKSPFILLPMALKATRAGIYRIGEGKTPISESYEAQEAAKDAADLSIGIMLAALVAALGEGGEDDDDPDAMKLVGSRPFGEASSGERMMGERWGGGLALKSPFGDFSFGRYEPLAVSLGVTIDAARSLKRWSKGSDASREFGTFIGYMIANATDKTFLGGLRTIEDALGRPSEIPGNFKKRLLESIVPNFIRQPLRNSDDFYRDTRTADWMHYLWPSGRFAEPKIDTVTGEPLKRQDIGFARLAIPHGTEPQMAKVDTMFRKFNRENPNDRKFIGPVYKDFYKHPATGEEVPMTAKQKVAYFQAVGKEFTRRVLTEISPAAFANPREEDIDDVMKIKQSVPTDVANRMFPKYVRKVR